MKIYTKKGDSGQTMLATGEKVEKHDKRVQLYGTADELNAIIGCALSFYSEIENPSAGNFRLAESLKVLQSLLFELGAELAGYQKIPGDSIIYDSDIETMETEIDTMQQCLKPMKNFILPGGTKTAAFLHQARTVCRRLERKMTAVFQTSAAETEAYPHPRTIIFTNRLSDYLFVAARYANWQASYEDIPWTSRTR